MDAIADLTSAETAFTRFLANTSRSKVLAERHPHLSKSERRLLRACVVVKAEPDLTDRQLEIAVAALANRTRNTNAADAAETSI